MARIRRNTKNPDRVLTTFYVESKEQLNEFKAICRSLDLTMSDVLRQCIADTIHEGRRELANSGSDRLRGGVTL